MSRLGDSLDGSSDLRLAIRLRDGSVHAWSDFTKRFGPLISTWCRGSGVSVVSREDIRQEVFLSVHRGISRFDTMHPRATFRGWLWKITRNCILQTLRRRPLMAPMGVTCETIFQEAPSAEEDVSRVSNTELLTIALERIRPTVELSTWEAFWRTAISGQSTGDVAKELGLTPASVRQAKSRMLRRLRKVLDAR